jgi:signal transduction histidine kinase
MRERVKRANRRLFVTVTLIVAAFFAGGVIAAYQFMAVSREAEDAEEDALPSVERLTDAHTALRRLNDAMETARDDVREGRGLDPAALLGPRQELQEALDAYQALPVYPGETVKVGMVLKALDQLDELAGAIGRPADGRPVTIDDRGGGGACRLACSHLDDTIHALIIFNAEHLRSHLERIDSIRVRAFVVLWITAFLSFVVALIASRLARALGQNERFLEERAEQWELFSGRIAHDILSPLQVVGLALSVASKSSKDAVVEKMSKSGLSALARVRAIADALLTFASAAGRPVPGEVASVPQVVTPLLEELLPVAEEKAVELSSEPLPGCEVACSAGILSLLLINLVQNAIKYMGDRPVRHVVLKIRIRSRVARFEVHDTGPGLTAAEARRVFDPFVRANVPGVSGIGLGLATVLRIAKAHDGRAGVDSVKGKGSVFWFELPIAEAPNSIPPGPVPDSPQP